MKIGTPEKRISRLLRTVGQPTRLKILMAIGDGEACVCHLEALLGLRQAYISQHLMALRKAEVLETRRDGRFIFYRLADPRILDLIALGGEISGFAESAYPLQITARVADSCVCPACEAALPGSRSAGELN